MNTDAVWHNLIDYVSSVDGFIGPVEYKEVAGMSQKAIPPDALMSHHVALKAPAEASF